MRVGVISGSGARLQAALTERALRLATRVAPDRSCLALDAPGSVPLPAGKGVRLLRQQGDNLGARMCHAVHEVWADHLGPVLVIGTDVPTLGEAHLGGAAAVLDEGHDVVFGPALDGGYYLVALRPFAGSVFDIDPGLWGGPYVLAASLARARADRLRVGQISPLRDLDIPADARALVSEGELPGDIAGLLSGGSLAT